jgi:hypothetical protein
VDSCSWRVVVEFVKPDGVGDWDSAALVQGFVAGLADLSVSRSFSHDDVRIFAYVASEAEAGDLIGDMETVLATAALRAEVWHDCWDPQSNAWTRADGSLTPALRSRADQAWREQRPNSRSRSRTEIRNEAGEVVWSSERSWPTQLKIALTVIPASIGIIWYSLSPGVGSYQLGSLLEFPLLLWLLLRMRRALSAAMQWAAAGVLALGGCLGYVIFGGPQWWYWGQYAIWPLALLILTRAKASFRDHGAAGLDGAWGPP